MSTDTRLDLDIIEALDFAYAPSCESSGHNEDKPVHDENGAYALVRVERDCGHSVDKFYCKAFTKHVTGPRPRTYCGLCGDWWGKATYTVITLVN